VWWSEAQQGEVSRDQRDAEGTLRGRPGAHPILGQQGHAPDLERIEQGETRKDRQCDHYEDHDRQGDSAPPVPSAPTVLPALPAQPAQPALQRQVAHQ
jgi:hypothetical protein